MFKSGKGLLINFIASFVFISGGIEREMSVEEIIALILARRSEISREHLLERLNKEKKKTEGLISDETLLRMIAAEFGIEVPLKVLAPALSVKNLVPGLNDVTLTGRILAIFPSKFFGTNKNGKFASLLIADQSDILRVVLWNDKTKLVDSGKIKVGQLIRLMHGYTREARSGKVELHLGEKSEIDINPQDAKEEDYPTLDKFTTKIGEITSTCKRKRVNIVGKVRNVSASSVFQRQDSSFGKVMRFTLFDATGEASIVVWNEKVDELEGKLKRGVELQIVNAKVKKTIGKNFEIHMDAETFVEVLESKEKFLKIAELREGLTVVNVEGEIVTKPLLREVKTSREEYVKLAVFELKDETGSIWVSAWRKHADYVKNLKIGDRIFVKNAFVRKGFGERLEISTRIVTSIIKQSSG